jgi:hypothetical protein
MSIVQTALVFGGIPLGLTALLALAVYGRTAVHRDRYRPGRPWGYSAVWYIPHPAAGRPAEPAGPALPAAPPAGVTTPAPPEPLGGASGEW